MEALADQPPLAHTSRRRCVDVAGQRLEIFTEWRELCPRILGDIAAAKRRVWVEMYIFNNDPDGQAIANALIDRAHAGLDVRLLVDAVGSQNTPGAFFEALRKAGVKVHLYHTYREAFWRLSPRKILNRRNHRKLMVMDEAVGYFGGMNIVDNDNLPGAGEKKLPMSAGWRDVHVRLEGAQATDLAESLDRSWRRALGQKIGRRPRTYRRGVCDSHDEAIRFFDSGPGLKYSRAARVFERLLKRSRQNVTLSMAYFIPIRGVLRALLRARRRGVRVRIILPGKTDVPIARRAAMYLYKKLLQHGLRLYERQDRMLHSKVMVVDGLWTVVGSCNFDPRSLFTNLEFLAVIRSEALAEVINSICLEEIQASRRVRLADCGKSTWWDRLLNGAAWSVRWWL